MRSVILRMCGMWCVRMRCWLKRGEAGQTYNVGSGRAVRIGDILQMVINQSGERIRVKKDPAKVRPLDTPSIRADIGKIQKITGWEPKIGLSQTVRETLDYWRGIEQ